MYSYHHPRAESYHPLQGNKTGYKHISVCVDLLAKDRNSFLNSFIERLWLVMSKNGLFSVYRLVIDAKPVRVMDLFWIGR